MAELITAVTEDALYDCLFDLAQTEMAIERIAVFRLDPVHEQVTCPRSLGLSAEYIQFVKDQYRHLPGMKALASQKPHLVPDVVQSNFSDEYKAIFAAENIAAIAIFPMFASEETLGVLIFYYSQPQQFGDEYINLVQTITSFTAVTLHRILLLSTTKRTLERERKLNNLVQALNSSDNIPAILQNTVQVAADVIEADAGLLGMRLDRETMIFYPFNVPSSVSVNASSLKRSVSRNVLEIGESILTSEYRRLENAQEKWIHVGVEAFLCVPVRFQSEIYGTLALFNIGSERQFDQQDLLLAELIGEQTAIRIKDLRELSETRRRAELLANSLAKQENKERQLHRFIQGISHELRSPLAIIHGHAELLADDSLGELTPIQSKSVNVMLRRVRLLNTLVDDLTALIAAETQEFQRELIDMGRLAKALLADYEIRAEAYDIRLQTAVPDDMLYVSGDDTHLHRVFDNLFSNAFKFTPAGGTISITFTNDQEWVYIDFSDNGEGIDPENLPRIFERFFQVTENNKPKRDGTGLGLALVKEIIEAHRGFVTVESTLGEGTTFHIMLPGVRRSTSSPQS